MIASYALSNTAGLAIEELDELEEKILVRLVVLDEDKPKKSKWYKIYYTNSTPRPAYFNWKGSRIYLSECMKVDY